VPVYVVLEIGGKAESPRNIYFMPVKEICYVGLFKGFIDKYEIFADKPVDDNEIKGVV
jgi:hypothetical protein